MLTKRQVDKMSWHNLNDFVVFLIEFIQLKGTRDLGRYRNIPKYVKLLPSSIAPMCFTN
jgi:hypothetical protein